MNTDCRCNSTPASSENLTDQAPKSWLLANSFIEAYQRLHRLHKTRARWLENSVEEK